MLIKPGLAGFSLFWDINAAHFDEQLRLRDYVESRDLRFSSLLTFDHNGLTRKISGTVRASAVGVSA